MTDLGFYPSANPASWTIDDVCGYLVSKEPSLKEVVAVFKHHVRPVFSNLPNSLGNRWTCSSPPEYWLLALLHEVETGPLPQNRQYHLQPETRHYLTRSWTFLVLLTLFCFVVVVLPKDDIPLRLRLYYYYDCQLSDTKTAYSLPLHFRFPWIVSWPDDQPPTHSPPFVFYSDGIRCSFILHLLLLLLLLLRSSYYI